MAWNKVQQNDYSVYAKRYIAAYSSKIDCADLALATLIDFAGRNNLPIRLKYYSGSWQWIAHDVTRDNLDTIKASVMRDLGALNVIDNTKPIKIEDAIAGDLIMTKNNNFRGHTRIIHSVESLENEEENEEDGYRVTWYQGNLPVVIPVKKVEIFRNISRVYGNSPRRWNFEQFDAT